MLRSSWFLPVIVLGYLVGGVGLSHICHEILPSDWWTRPPKKKEETSPKPPEWYTPYLRLLDHRVTIPHPEFGIEQYRKKGLFQSLLQFCRKHLPMETSFVGISLSGGVDSMVLMNMLVQLTHYRKLDYKFQVVAFHVNYNNRYEANEEEEFLKNYCEKLGVVFVSTRMYFTRSNTERTEYEEKSKQIRFDNYRSLMKEYQIPGFFVGHHADDLGENTWTNLAKKRSLLDLSGMVEYRVNDGVPLMRPMLHHPKSEVLELAELAGIPYFKDSTPRWSRRGTLREEILPVLQKSYPDILVSLYQLGQESDAFLADLHRLIDPALAQQSVGGKYGLYLDTRIFPEGMSLSFWKLVLQELLHSHGFSMLTQGVLKTWKRHLPHEGMFCFSGGKGRQCFWFQKQFLLLRDPPVPTPGFQREIKEWDPLTPTRVPLNRDWSVEIRQITEETFQVPKMETVRAMVDKSQIVLHAFLVPGQPIVFSHNTRYRDPYWPWNLTKLVPTPSQKLEKGVESTAYMMEVRLFQKILGGSSTDSVTTERMLGGLDEADDLPEEDDLLQNQDEGLDYDLSSLPARARDFARSTPGRDFRTPPPSPTHGPGLVDSVVGIPPSLGWID